MFDLARATNERRAPYQRMSLVRHLSVGCIFDVSSRLCEFYLRAHDEEFYGFSAISFQ
jgi:hypothetical protein